MAKSIMLQGTMSNVGKTLLCAGLGRVLRRAGYRVAPFKAQNMAPNAHLTPQGLAIGRAQAVQAEACGIPPDIRMNPILLRPVSDRGSQVIVNGQPRGVLRAAEYFALRPSLVPEVARAYQSLAQDYDIIVIEGAGSPAEINLGRDEFVNMGMARLAGSPVLLVGDIDRGGVFAQLHGTLLLLEPEDRARVKGLILNKFRGDISLLTPGLAMLEELTATPVAGVVPWLDVDIDDEDSLSLRSAAAGEDAGEALDIAVLKLPRMADFTDFAPLRGVRGVHLRYVERLRDLQGNGAPPPDLLILPDTRSPAADLQWLRERGLADTIAALAAAGTPVLGLSGGYQMLGLTLPDEAAPGQTVPGLDLLPVVTQAGEGQGYERIRGEIASLRYSGSFFSCMGGAAVEGSVPRATFTFIPPEPVRRGNRWFCALLYTGDRAWQEGCVCGSVCGSALRGLLDAPACRDALLRALFSRRGLPPPAAFDLAAYRERQYDLLADGVAAGLDMEMVYRLLQ